MKVHSDNCLVLFGEMRSCGTLSETVRRIVASVRKKIMQNVYRAYYKNSLSSNDFGSRRKCAVGLRRWENQRRN